MEVNYLAILAAGFVAWVLGAVWYSPILVGKIWQKESGMSDEKVQGGNMALIFGTSFILMTMMMFGLSFIIGAHDNITIGHGAFHGMLTGIMFAATSIGINYLYQRKSIKLYAIDAFYQVLMLAAGGAVLAAMS